MKSDDFRLNECILIPVYHVINPISTINTLILSSYYLFTFIIVKAIEIE